MGAQKGESRAREKLPPHGGKGPQIRPGAKQWEKKSHAEATEACAQQDQAWRLVCARTGHGGR